MEGVECSMTETSALSICPLCVIAVEGEHIHNVWRLYHPEEIKQRSVTELSLEPATFAVLVYGSWVDIGMRREHFPAVGLS